MNRSQRKNKGGKTNDKKQRPRRNQKPIRSRDSRGEKQLNLDFYFFSCRLQGKRANKAKKMIEELVENDTSEKS